MAKKKVAKKSSARTPRRRGMDQSSFLIISGGGLVVILLVLFSFGMFSTGRQSGADRYITNANAEAKETVVTIQNNTFSSPVTVKAGTKVTWMNSDSAEHTVVADDNSFDLGGILSSTSKSYTFTTPGTYPYHCMMHPGMTGTIIVE